MPAGVDLEVSGERGYEPEDLVYGTHNEVLGVSRGLRYNEPRHRTNHYLRRGGLVWVDGQAVPAQPAAGVVVGVDEDGGVRVRVGEPQSTISEIRFSTSPFGREGRRRPRRQSLTC